MIVFLVIVLGFYGLINAYVFRHGRQYLAGSGKGRTVYAAVMLLLILAYPLGRFTDGLARNPISDFMTRLGSFYLGYMLYLLLFFLILDILKVAGDFLPILGRLFAGSPNKPNMVLFASVFGLALLVILGGYLNSLHPRIRTLEIRTNKPPASVPNLTIALASDIHLGKMTRCARLEKIVKSVNNLNPDILLLAGDIVDESVSPEEEEEMIAILKRIRAPLGIFSVTGNHEYYSGVEKSVSYLERADVRVLEDKAARVADSFYIIGRKDRTAYRFGQDGRLSLEEILDRDAVDRNLLLILLDHQPLHLEEAQQAGIDLQLSGHTHAGQLFPLNLINKLVYEKNWGCRKKGGTHFYVSCGVGTWGPAVRTGSVPEIVAIKVLFE